MLLRGVTSRIIPGLLLVIAIAVADGYLERIPLYYGWSFYGIRGGRPISHLFPLSRPGYPGVALFPSAGSLLNERIYSCAAKAFILNPNGWDSAC